MNPGKGQQKHHKCASELSLFLMLITMKTNARMLVHRILVTEKQGTI